MEKQIIRVITINPKANNRFTIYFIDGTYLSIDQNEASKWQNLKLPDQMRVLRLLNQDRFLNVDEQAINFFDLPASVQEEVIKAVRKAEK